MNEETIRLEKLSIGYKERGGTTKYIARDIEASLHQGELTFLLGANGAGKSTLMRTMIGSLPPLKGHVIVEGKDMNSYSNSELAKRIGVVLTERPELGRMTVNELVGMGRSPYTNFLGKLSNEDSVIIRSALDMVGMLNLGERMADTLSDGERQKAMIAKALAQETPIILLDEPTAFLDFPSKVEIMLLLRKLAHKERKTIFLSTHDVELALQMADSLWLMSRKREQYFPNREEVYGKENQYNSNDNDESLFEDKLSREFGDSLKIGTPRDLADNGELDLFFRGDNFLFDAKNMRYSVCIDR